MAVQRPNSFRTGPDERGHFGIYGGRFVAETLMPLILELEQAYAQAKADPAFQKEMDGHLANYVGRPSPLYFAQRLTEHCGGAKIYLKREELNHTGAHKVNNVLGQIMTKADWPARLHRLGHGRLVELAPVGSELWLDGGHNPDGGRAIAAALADLEERVSRPLVLIVGMLATKDSEGFLSNFAGLARRMIAVPVPNAEKGLSADAVAAAARATST